MAREDSGPIVVTPGPAHLTLTSQVPVVHIPKPHELVEESRRRRWMFGAVGVVAAAIDLIAGVVGGSGTCEIAGDQRRIVAPDGPGRA